MMRSIIMLLTDFGTADSALPAATPYSIRDIRYHCTSHVHFLTHDL
ncbi:MAG TPA: hypothetical protein VGM67_17110 [Gemmatimonadaceae bacterium]|jgi:hypothetical protein